MTSTDYNEKVEDKYILWIFILTTLIIGFLLWYLYMNKTEVKMICITLILIIGGLIVLIKGGELKIPGGGGFKTEMKASVAKETDELPEVKQ